jgi:cysteinyl-tRNA synthetase
MHNEMLQVEGKKMSKSLGNFFTVRELLEGHGPSDKGVPGEVIRFVMLSTHYRKPMDWTEKKAEEAAQTLFKWRSLTEGVVPADVYSEDVVKALSDDLNTSLAISELRKLEVHPRALLHNANLLGLLKEGHGGWYSLRKIQFASSDNLRVLLRIRKQAKLARDFALADAIRDELTEKGITLKDMPDGLVQPSTSFDSVREYVSKISEVEKREIFGDLLGENGELNMGAATDRYVELVAKELSLKFGETP